jgi:AcrR family transcriptional regulator
VILKDISLKFCAPGRSLPCSNDTGWQNGMASAEITRLDRISRKRVDKFAERRTELAEAAILTLAELGYARTSLREIAQNSEFSHGVLHYYFSDKLDLIICCVRLYKSRCVTRYDNVIAEAGTFVHLLEGFVNVLGNTMREEAHLHRLWYDLRAQALYEPAFRADVHEIDNSLEAMIWRILVRLGALHGEATSMTPALAYAVFDGLFQQCLLKHLSGDPTAIPQMQESARLVLQQAFKK